MLRTLYRTIKCLKLNQRKYTDILENLYRKNQRPLYHYC